MHRTRALPLQQTLAALEALAAAGVIRQLSAGTYDRQYAATELFDLVTAYEEGIVGPARSAREAPQGLGHCVKRRGSEDIRSREPRAHRRK